MDLCDPNQLLFFTDWITEMASEEDSLFDEDNGSVSGDDQTPISNGTSYNRRQLFSGTSSHLVDKTNRSEMQLILKELRRTNSSIDNLSDRMDSIDNRLKSVEDKQTEALTPSSSSSVEKIKRKVPSRVRVCHCY